MVQIDERVDGHLSHACCMQDVPCSDAKLSIALSILSRTDSQWNYLWQTKIKPSTMPITSFSGPSQTWWQFPLVRHKTTARKTHQNSHNEANVITNEQQVETLKKQCNHCQLQNKGLLALHFKRSSTQQAWPTNLWTSVPIGVPIEVATILMYHVHWRHKTFFFYFA